MIHCPISINLPFGADNEKNNEHQLLYEKIEQHSMSNNVQKPGRERNAYGILGEKERGMVRYVAIGADR